MNILVFTEAYITFAALVTLNNIHYKDKYDKVV